MIVLRMTINANTNIANKYTTNVINGQKNIVQININVLYKYLFIVVIVINIVELIKFD